MVNFGAILAFIAVNTSVIVMHRIKRAIESLTCPYKQLVSARSG